MNSAVSENVLGATASWTAAARALESTREDALVRDPWADALCGDPGRAWIAGRPPGSTLPMILRTRYFDDWLRQAAADGIRQVVLLAAGLDTRAYRLDWPDGTVIYEADQPNVITRKEQILAEAGAQPQCIRRAIAADLTEPWQDALVGAGFEPAVPACFLLEGFLFYLPSHTGQKILDEVLSFAAPGSRIGFDVVNGAMMTSPITKVWLDMQAAAGAPWIGSLDDPLGFLGERGWEGRLTQAGQPDANHGRWTLPVMPVDMPAVPHNWFVTGQKRASG
jgi:methyltransferase (TIGR00027 family)